MKTPPSFLFRICFICICLLEVGLADAQNKSDDKIINQWAVEPLKIDGKLNDWGDSLKYFNEKTKFSFDITNNGQNLYLAIKSLDKQNLNRIFAKGISFSVNNEGKKKPEATVVFPIIDRGSLAPKPANGKTPPSVKEMQGQMLSKIRQINVNGFADILDGPVSLNNTYGVSAAASFDEQDNLIIEMVIPFRLLQITDQKTIACLIELNGINPPKGAYDPYSPFPNARNRRYGGYDNRDYGNDRRPGIDKRLLTAGFWIESTLAQNPTNK